MRKLSSIILAFGLLCGARAFALGIDIGPVHIHGTKVKVGSTVEMSVSVSKISYDEDQKDRVRRLSGTRVGSDEKLEIRVPWSDLDDESKEVLKKVKTEAVYKMKLEKTADDWKVHKIRRD